MPCFSRINADVKEGFCCLEEANCVLCSLDRAAEDVVGGGSKLVRRA